MNNDQIFQLILDAAFRCLQQKPVFFFWSSPSSPACHIPCDRFGSVRPWRNMKPVFPRQRSARSQRLHNQGRRGWFWWFFLAENLKARKLGGYIAIEKWHHFLKIAELVCSKERSWHPTDYQLLQVGQVTADSQLQLHTHLVQFWR